MTCVLESPEPQVAAVAALVVTLAIHLMEQVVVVPFMVVPVVEGALDPALVGLAVTPLLLARAGLVIVQQVLLRVLHRAAAVEAQQQELLLVLVLMAKSL